jgi:DNA-directed RNA polymerase subunit M/transcription elongation factor TFIIS
MWEHADSTAGELSSSPLLGPADGLKKNFSLLASCDKCNHNRAYFFQLQIRSADEPMTTCKHPSELI